MNKKHRSSPARVYAPVLGIVVLLLVTMSCSLLSFQTSQGPVSSAPPAQAQATIPLSDTTAQAKVPTLPASQPTVQLPQTGQAGAAPGASSDMLIALHKQVSPGVVSIDTLITQGNQSGEAAGSGFVIDKQGYIITNNHVVEGANEVIVTFFNGTQMDAKIIGTDGDSDLAVLQVKQLPDGVQPLSLGDSDKVQVGEWVIAMGNPFALGTSMSTGIVSAIGRTIESLTQYSIPQAIQTDAAINPGNSGGPLINMQGQVIGVDAQIATGGTSNANTGVGFAIPVNVVRLVAPVLIKQGVYHWPWLGVRGGSVNLVLARQQNLPVQLGAYIAEVTPGGPAAKAGMQANDVVIGVDGKAVNSFDDLLTIIAFHQPGDQVTLTVMRNGKQVQVPVTLEPRPANVAPTTPNNSPLP